MILIILMYLFIFHLNKILYKMRKLIIINGMNLNYELNKN